MIDTNRSHDRRSRIDLRFVIGIALVAASIAGVWAIVAAVDDSREAFTARSTLTTGSLITADDLVTVHVRLGTSETFYLSPSTLPDEGLRVQRTVLEGELVPKSAVASDAARDLTNIVVPVTARLSAQIVAGTLVDLWATNETDDGDREPPSVLVADAEVVEVLEEGSLFAGTSGSAVELLVPTEKTASVLESLAAGDSMTLVPATPEAEG